MGCKEKFDPEDSRLELIVDGMNAAVFELNLKTGSFYSSEGYGEYAISAVPVELIRTGRVPSDIIHPDDRAAMLRFFADARSGSRRAEVTLRMRLLDGGCRWCRIVGLFFRDCEGRPERTIGMIIDVSEEKEKTFMLDRLLNNLPGGVAIFKVSEKLECQYFSDGFMSISGYTRDELGSFAEEGDLFERTVYPPDLESCIKKVRTQAGAGLPISFTYRSIKKDGALHWLTVSASVIRYEDGCPVYYGVFTVPPEEAVLFQRLVEDSTIGCFVAERASRRIFYLNNSMRSIYGLPASEALIGRSIYDRLREGDLLLVNDEVASLSRDSYAEFHKTYDGKYYHIRARALDWNGTDAYVLYVSDETQEYEKHLFQQELIDRVPTGLGIYEMKHGRITQNYLNNSFYRMMKYTEEEHEARLGGDFLLGVHPDDIKVVAALIKKLASGADSASAEFRNLCGDGSYLWVRLVANVVNRHNTEFSAYCGYEDISEAVAARKRLEQSNNTIRAQYEQELEQRRILEKDSSITVQFNVTQNRLVKFSTALDYIVDYKLGSSSGDIMSALTARIPVEDERKRAAEFYDITNSLDMFRRGVADHSVEYRSRQKDGCLHWMHAVSHLCMDRTTGDIISYTYVRDVDVEKKRELAAESVIDEETDYVAILSVINYQALPLRLNNERDYPDWRARNAFDFSEFSSPKHMRRVLPDDLSEVKRFFDADRLIGRLETEPVITVTYRYNASDGTVRRKKTRAFYLDDTREDVVITRRDITDLYDEEMEQQRVLQKALDSAESASRAKSEFLSNMSHEIRTPLNAILGLTALARSEEELSPDVSNYLTDIYDSGKFMLNIINDILDVAKIERDAVELHPEPYEYKSFIAQIVSVFAPLCREKNITLNMNPMENVPAILVDPMRFQQIFFNIFSNAVKYTPKGGRIDHYTEATFIGKDLLDCRCHVIDNGIGMSEEFLQHCLDPFSQEKQSGFSSVQGTGLGLSIANSLAKMMGGGITVHSRLGEGTEVIVHAVLPVVAPPEAPASDDVCSSEAACLAGKRILLCEDNRLNAAIARKLLEKKGCLVDCAENGKKGLELFAASPEGHYSAVLMDIRMPEMDGLEAAAALRALHRSDAERVPIIAMSANAFDEDVKASLAAGMNTHLAKPVEPYILYNTLAQQINKKRP